MGPGNRRDGRMNAHDWQPVYPYDANGTVQCARCGVIRILVRWHKEPFTRYSRAGANIIHDLEWYCDEPPCEEKALPEGIADRSEA